MQPPGDTAPSGPPLSARQLLRQQRELEEKRKFGLAPLAVDVVTQQEISPNVPQSIAQAPWYYGAAGPTLEHQRQRTGPVDGALEDRLDQVKVLGQAKRYTAGSCKNCGARTHKTHECTQAKKRVGTVYSGKVTGVDVELQTTEKNFSQKRDRYVGDIGVDLLKGSACADADDAVPDSAEAPAKRPRAEEAFGTLTARHGGGAITELPKYLQNLDAPEGAFFFDPKTGSMRANPNTADPTKAFQGDLERYRAEGFHDYVETQYRFLTGQSKGFVDFDYDEEMQRRQQGRHGTAIHSAGEAETVAEAPQAALLRSLYGFSTQQTATGRTVAASAPAPLLPTEAAAQTSSPTTVEQKGAADVLAAQALAQQATRTGHRSAYGSYFDPAQFAWGYHCCRGLGKDAPSCTVRDGEEGNV